MTPTKNSTAWQMSLNEFDAFPNPALA